MEHWAKKKKTTKTSSKHVWTLLGTTNFENFLILKFFEDSTLHGTLGKKFFHKTRLDTFGNDFELFWNFENFLIFLKFFEDSTLHGTLGKNFLPKKLPQNMFKTRLNTFGNGFEHFWNFETFLIF